MNMDTNTVFRQTHSCPVSQFHDIVHFQNLLLAADHGHCVWIQSGIDASTGPSKDSWIAHYNSECEPGVTFETEWPAVSISDNSANLGNKVRCSGPTWALCLLS